MLSTKSVQPNSFLVGLDTDMDFCYEIAYGIIRVEVLLKK